MEKLKLRVEGCGARGSRGFLRYPHFLHENNCLIALNALLLQVPLDIVDDMNERFNLEYIPVTIHELDSYSCDPNFDCERCLDELKVSETSFPV